jgi:hypothetical protein
MPPPLFLSCLNHADRPASAKCRECGRSFCKECIVDEEGRMTCSPCLAKVHARARAAVRGESGLLDVLTSLALLAVALFVLWHAFDFFNGSVMWITDWWNKPD